MIGGRVTAAFLERTRAARRFELAVLVVLFALLEAGIFYTSVEIREADDVANLTQAVTAGRESVDLATGQVNTLVTRLTLPDLSVRDELIAALADADREATDLAHTLELYTGGLIGQDLVDHALAHADRIHAVAQEMTEILTGLPDDAQAPLPASSRASLVRLRSDLERWLDKEITDGDDAIRVGSAHGQASSGEAAGLLLVAGLLLPVLSGAAVLAIVRQGVRHREETLRQVRVRDRALAASPDGVLITDASLPGQPVVYVNPAYTTLTGVPSARLIGRPNPLHDLLADRMGPDGSAELELTRRDGTAFWSRITETAVRDEHERISHRVWSITDITPRLEADARLRRSEEYHRTLTENSSDITAIIDHRGRLTYMSPSVLRVLGYEPAQYQGTRVLAHVHPDDRRLLVTQFRDAFRSEQTTGVPAAVRYATADGGWAWLESVTRRITNEDGRPVLVTNSRDVTARLHAEEALGETQLRYRETLDTIQLGAITVDRDGRIIYVNDRLLAMTGRSRDELLGTTLGPALIAPDDPVEAAAYDARFRTSMADGTLPLHAEVEITTRLRERRLISFNRTFQRDGDLHITAVTSLGEDITERQAREDALRATSSRLATLVENMQAAVLVEDERHHAVLANQSFCTAFGLPFSPRMLDGWPIPVIVDAIRSRFLDAEGFAVGVDELIREGEPVVGEEVGFADGRVFERDYLPIRHDGELMGHLWLYRDVTARVRTADELRAARDAAEAANRAKSAFLATMSHEIRTPMNGVLTAANLLMDTSPSPEQNEWIGMIRTSGDALLTIINDILDFSKIEAGRLELEAIDFDLRQTVESAVDLFAEPAAARGLELVSVVDEEIPAVLRGDPARLRQVVLNFLSNALKFTESGEVVARVTLEDDSHDGTVLLRFAVRDSGIGIPQETLPRLFRPFSQADGSMSRRYGGTGLGLAICRQLAEMMGGTVGVTSTVGAGSTFWFTGRFDVTAVGSGLTVHPAMAGRRALVVDDNTTHREILGHQLRAWGLEVTTAATSLEAMTALRRAVGDRRPIHIALLDETLPVADGFTLARLIKEETPIANTRVVLLAAPGRRAIAGRTAAAGIATYLRKPVHHGELRSVLTDLLEGGAEAIQVSPEQVETADLGFTVERGTRILLAEDNAVNARLASVMLERLGCVVDIAGDGVEALEALRRASYDVVLMDCQMPELDGFEATRRIRSRETEERMGHLPIIAMTANAMAGDRERCLEAGMDDYVAKPIDRRDLLEALGRQLGPREGQGSAVDGLPPGATPPGATPPAAATVGAAADGQEPAVPVSGVGRTMIERWPVAAAAPLVDVLQLRSIGALDDEGGMGILAEIVNIFAVETPDVMARVAEALDAGDVVETQRAAHKLKGGCGQIGAARMWALARDLDLLAKEGRLDGADELYERLDAVLGATISELRGLARSGRPAWDPGRVHHDHPAYATMPAGGTAPAGAAPGPSDPDRSTPGGASPADSLGEAVP